MPVPSDPLAGIDMSGKPYLPPGEVAAVAKNVFQIGIDPVNKQLDFIVGGLRRMFGDGPESGLPPALRAKGLFQEIKDDHAAFVSEQRGWKVEDDASKKQATAERQELYKMHAQTQDELKKLRTDFENEKENSHKMRMLVGMAIKWVTTKDDRFSIMVSKVTLLLGAMGMSITAISVGGYKGLIWMIKHFIIHSK